MRKTVDTIKDAFTAELPGFKQVEYFSGRLTVKMLDKLVARAPALLFTFWTVRQFVPGPDSRWADTSMAAYILTKAGRDEDGMRTNRDMSALLLMDGVSAFLTGDAWPLEAPTNVRADNLYSSDGNGVSLWAVSWDQEIKLGDADTAYEDLNEFLKAGATWSTVDGDPLFEDVITVRES